MAGKITDLTLATSVTGSELAEIVQSGTNKKVALNTIVPALNTQVANTVQAGPTSGGDATPTFRALVTNDISANMITNAKLAQMPTLTIKGNNTGGTADVANLTVAQVNAILPTFTTTLNGLVPNPGSSSGLFLKDDGTWASAGGGDMVLASIQTVTGAKTFNSGKLILAGATSGTTILNANATAGSGTVTLPTTGTLATLAGSETFTNKDLTSGTNTFPTFNQNTTGSAATLTTSRTIYGNSFNGSANLTQVIASTYGGTGNGFTAFSGPTTSEKTFTLPNASATILTDNATVTSGQGGTGVNNGGRTLTINTNSFTVTSSNQANTLTLANNLTTSGNFALTLTQTNTTNVTLPTTGTLATLAGSETFTNKGIDFANNTVTMTKTQLNTAISDADVATLTGNETLTNKRFTPRPSTTASSATPTINTDNTDFFSVTALAVDITSFTTNLSGTPTDGQTLWIAITGTATRNITWGASFEASGTIALPTATNGTTRLDVGFVWNTATSKWRCVATA